MRSIYCVVALATLLLVAPVDRARASVMFSGSGINPEVGVDASGSATFEITGDTLTLVLQNTTSPRTASQGNVMSGVAFDIDSASPALALTGTALDGASKIWTSELASNTSDPLAGSWTDQLGISPLADYGVATTGFAGGFDAGSITLGNGGPNYGIVAADTFDGTDVPFGGSQFPFIQDSMEFTFSGASGISESQIANVTLIFGTDGTGIIQTPEPCSMLILIGLSAGLACVRGWRR